MNIIPFERAFPALKASLSLVNVCEGAFVQKMNIIAAERTIRAEIRFARAVCFSDFTDLKEAVIKAYSLKDLSFTPFFPETPCGEFLLPYINDFLMREHRPVCPLLDGAEFDFSDDSLVIAIPDGCMTFVERTGVCADLGRLLSSMVFRSVSVSLKGSDAKEGSSSDFEERMLKKELAEIERGRAEARANGNGGNGNGNGNGGKEKRQYRAKNEGPANGEPVAPAEGDEVLLGRAVKGRRTVIKDVTADSGNVIVMMEVFNIEATPAGRGLCFLCFDGTDYTGSLRVKRRMPETDSKELVKKLKGAVVAVAGLVEFDQFYDDLVIRPTDIVSVKKRLKSQRFDDNPHKRAELHLHTTMSAMDATASAGDLIARAASFGHKAVAITDHGVVQAFPEAMAAAKKHKIKVIYGMEAYYVVDSEASTVFSGSRSFPLNDEFICFDVETTGMNPVNDALTQIGAVRLKNGVVVDSFETFVDPERPIPANIVELTGITDEMVKGAPSQDEAVRALLSFAGEAPLVAHNASFDVGFVAARTNQKAFDYIDTLELSRTLFPALPRHRLNSLATHFKVDQINHHRADDDARVLGLIFIKLMEEFNTRAPEVTTTKGLNEALTSIMLKNRSEGEGFRGLPVWHLIILAKNRTGLKNLYRLVSSSNIDYLDSRRRPLIPKSFLMRHREGLLIGSACEAGELYTAAREGADSRKLAQMGRFYDFIEIQPIGNNEFLIRDGHVKSQDDLKSLNRRLMNLADELKKPIVATGDVHFLDPGDAVFRAVSMNAKGFSEAENQPPLYLKTTDEMLEEFSYLGLDRAFEAVVTNPNKIADMCDELLPVPAEQAPPVIEGSAEELEAIVRRRFFELYGDKPDPFIKDRLEIELGNIITHGYDIMYIAAQKLVARSISQGYLVGSRGSVGSSFVAYLAGITEVNALPPHYRCASCKTVTFADVTEGACGADLPDKACPDCGERLVKDGFNIPFATFLGFNADKTPDIDLNFSGEYQSRAHAHTEEIFGKGYVFRAGTIGTVAEKTAVGYARKYAEDKGLDLNRAEIMRLAKGCEGIKRTSGQHPGGVMVVPRTRDIYDFSPIQYPADDKKSGVITTHFDYHAIHDNLLKLDILGHDDPTMIRMLQDLTGVDPMAIPLDDRATMSIFTSAKSLNFTPDMITGETGAIAIPEFGTRNSRQMLLETMPRTLDGLIRICGLSHGTNVWRNNAQDIIKQGVSDLNGVICARDDIMEYLMRMGLEPKTAFAIMESVRRGYGLTPEWEADMKAHAVPDWYVESCKKIEYMFPKAHAVAYVMMAFRIAWFKVHNPLEFYAAYFTIRAGALDIAVMGAGDLAVTRRLNDLASRRDSALTANEKQLAVTLEVCHEFYLRGFKFLPVDVYRSDPARFNPESGALRPPFTAIPGLGLSAAEDVARERQRMEFISVDEFAMRCRVSSTLIETMRAIGAFGKLAESAQLTLF